MTHEQDRRRFVTAGLASVAGLALAGRAPGDPAPRRAVIIGHTGRGDYGHGLDMVFQGRPGIEVAAVADPDPAGRERARQRTGAARAYADYREMLRLEQPALVSIAPRHADQHRDMLLAALGVGAHVICEKPLVGHPAEADEVLTLARQLGRRIAVAHQMRLQPQVVALRDMVVAGELGELVALRGWGKQDQRAGGEDLMVLGTHVFDLMRLFAGDARWCTAQVTTAGRPIAANDGRLTRDNVGLVAGDEVEARFGFDRGVTASFTSRAKLRDYAGYWGLEVTGTKGTARILADIPARVRLLTSSGWQATPRIDRWDRPAFTVDEPADTGAFGRANSRVADSWLAAIEAGTEPGCSGADGAAAVEMVAAVYRASLAGAQVRLPLAERDHPLRAGA